MLITGSPSVELQGLCWQSSGSGPFYSVGSKNQANLPVGKLSCAHMAQSAILIRLPLLGQLFVIFTALLANACSSTRDSNSTMPVADVIVINADVYTSDIGQPRAEAFAVHDGKFLVVGAPEDVRALAGDDTEVIDANGATLVPGFVDGHTHLVLGSGLATGVDLSEIEDKDEWLRIIAEKAATVPDGD